jgi:hypothetical protein
VPGLTEDASTDVGAETGMTSLDARVELADLPVDGLELGSFNPSFAAASGVLPLNSIEVLDCTEKVECVGEGVCNPNPDPSAPGKVGTPRKLVTFSLSAAVRTSGARAFVWRDDDGMGESGRRDVLEAFVTFITGFVVIDMML